MSDCTCPKRAEGKHGLLCEDVLRGAFGSVDNAPNDVKQMLADKGRPETGALPPKGWVVYPATDSEPEHYGPPAKRYEGFVEFADGSLVSIQCFEGRCDECPDGHGPAETSPPGLAGYYCLHNCKEVKSMTDVNTRPWATTPYDAAALDSIAEILRDPEWGVGMLEDIAEAVRKTDRSVDNYPDDRSTWERH